MTRPIDPHHFNATLQSLADAHGYEPTCLTCGLVQSACEIRYKPRTIQLGDGYPKDETGAKSSGTSIAVRAYDQIESMESRRPKGEVCQRFVGKREWGIGPAEPWRICQSCGWPKAQHELPSCPAALSIRGESFVCELTTPHGGWAHSNREAQAIWTDNKDHATLGVKGGMNVTNVYTGPGEDPREAYS